MRLLVKPVVRQKRNLPAIPRQFQYVIASVTDDLFACKNDEPQKRWQCVFYGSMDVERIVDALSCRRLIKSFADHIRLPNLEQERLSSLSSGAVLAPDRPDVGIDIGAGRALAGGGRRPCNRSMEKYVRMSSRFWSCD